MTEVLLLVSYAVTASILVPRILSHSVWPGRTPRLGVLAWQCLSISVMAAVSLAGLSFIRGPLHLGAHVATLEGSWASLLLHLSERATCVIASIVGTFLFVAVLIRLLFCSARLGLERRAERGRLVQILDLVACRDAASGSLVLDHPAPFAFCLPGAGRRVVVTSALVAELRPEQLSAVFAHEGAHLRQHHHLVIFVTRALCAAFGPLAPWLRAAEREVAYLLELMADDAAADAVGDVPLREALSVMRQMPIGAPALAASATGVDERLRRLQSRSTALSTFPATLVGAGIFALALFPLQLVLVPLWPAVWHDICFLG